MEIKINSNSSLGMVGNKQQGMKRSGIHIDFYKKNSQFVFLIYYVAISGGFLDYTLQNKLSDVQKIFYNGRQWIKFTGLDPDLSRLYQHRADVSFYFQF